MRWWISLLFISLVYVSAYSQEITVNGTILNAENGKPLPQVGVYFDGTSIGTISNQDGYFRLWTKQQVKYIVVEADGFESQRVSIDDLNNPELEIKLIPEAMLQRLLPTKKSWFRNEKSKQKA